MTRFKTRMRERHCQTQDTRRPALRFTPEAWGKLLYLRDEGPTEVGGFGISAENDPLLVENLKLVRQSCTSVSVIFEDLSVADHFDECVDAGLPPERFARIWIHTHPGRCATPSGTDEETFARVFGGCDWAVMAILAKGGASYARVRFNAGPGGELVIPVEVDFTTTIRTASPQGWEAEYARCVNEHPTIEQRRSRRSSTRDLAGALVETSAHAARRCSKLSDVPISEFWEWHDEQSERDLEYESSW